MPFKELAKSKVEKSPKNYYARNNGPEIGPINPMREKKQVIVGERWKVGSPIRSGGQGDVSHCTDISGVQQGQFAIKLPQSRRKHPRFKNEILAVKGLDHHNIVKIVDHSDLDKFGEPENKPYLVMPYASGGDLSAPDRRKSFADDLVKTIAVLKDLASGLAAAHGKGIIHRDIKPGNILFAADGEVVISDFGICFIRGQERLTESNENVGPRHFMAPELEGGRALEVTKAADVYSLGKVAYYMISGGKILPREDLYENGNYAVFNKSNRHQLLGILCGQMICAAQKRLQSMQEVIERLDMIENWRPENQNLGFDSEGLDLVLKLQAAAEKKADAAVQAQTQKKEADQLRMAKQQNLAEWLIARFSAAEETIGKTGRLKASRDYASIPDGFKFEIGGVLFGSKGGEELAVIGLDGFIHVLQIHVCEDIDDKGNQLSPDDPRLVMVAFYQKYQVNARHTPKAMGYLSQPSLIGKGEGSFDLSTIKPDSDFPLKFGTTKAISRSIKANSSLFHQFSWKDWPEQKGAIEAFVNTAFIAFLGILTSGTSDISD